MHLRGTDANRIDRGSSRIAAEERVPISPFPKMVSALWRLASPCFGYFSGEGCAEEMPVATPSKTNSNRASRKNRRTMIFRFSRSYCG
jgi:hypothetical protein